MKRIQFILLILAISFIVIQQADGQLPPPNVFAVQGVVYASDGVTPAGDGFIVTVENVTKGLTGEDITGSTAGPSQYVATFVDFKKQVVSPDDLIQITVKGTTDKVLVTKQVSVTTKDIDAGFLKIDVNLTYSSDDSHTFVIRGTVFMADGMTLAGDGLKVTVENLSKEISQTDVTGTFAEKSQYVTTFVDTEQSVAEVGDKIEVRVEDTERKLLGEAEFQLSSDMVTAGFASKKVNLKRSETPTKKYPAWDVNDDGTVNIFDLVLVGTHFGEDYRAEGPEMAKIDIFSGKEANVWIETQNKIRTEGTRVLIVDINVEPVSDLYGCQFDLAFDPKVLEVVGAKGGDILTQDGAFTYWNVERIDNRKGRIGRVIYVRKATKKGISTGGTIATVVFRVKDISISDSTKINFTNLALADVDARVINAVVEKTLLRWEELFVPGESMLLQNYPNPFNPETWIPYQLKEGHEVTIRIYSLTGELVRTLVLGHKAAGLYVSRDRAAYWDGRNKFGSLVSSGVYFYSIQTGDFSAVRKLTVLK